MCESGGHRILVVANRRSGEVVEETVEIVDEIYFDEDVVEEDDDDVVEVVFELELDVVLVTQVVPVH